MSYAGEYVPGPHDCYPPNCEKCIRAKQERNGKTVDGVLHSDNGAGWCVGHNVGGLCTVLVSHCPVLNTPEQLAATLAEDHEAAIRRARRRLMDTHRAYEEARKALARLEGPDAGD